MTLTQPALRMTLHMVIIFEMLSLQNPYSHTLSLSLTVLDGVCLRAFILKNKFIIKLNNKIPSNKIVLIQLKLNFKRKKKIESIIKSATYSVTSNPSQYIYNKIHGKCTVVCLLFHHNSSTDVFRDVILYATLRGCTSVEDALVDVWFSLLGLSYSLAYTYKV